MCLHLNWLVPTPTVQVNLANQSFKHIEQKFIQITKGVKIPIGKEEKISFNGMKQLGFLKMMEKCEPRPDTGVLYVFKNKYWSESQKTLNITNFDMELAKKRIAEENAKNNIPIMKMGEEPVLKMGGEPILKMGDEDRVSGGKFGKKQQRWWIKRGSIFLIQQQTGLEV